MGMAAIILKYLSKERIKNLKIKGSEKVVEANGFITSNKKGFIILH